MFAVVVKFHIQPEHVPAFREAMVDNARQSVETEVGCHQFDVCCDPADPTLFFLYELYDSVGAFEAHLASRHFQEFNLLTSEWVSTKVVNAFERVYPDV